MDINFFLGDSTWIPAMFTCEQELKILHFVQSLPVYMQACIVSHVCAAN